MYNIYMGRSQGDMMEAMDMSVPLASVSSAIWVQDHHHEVGLCMGIILMYNMSM